MRKGLLVVGLISGLGIAGLTSCGILDNKKTSLTRNESLSMQAATSLSMVGDLNAPKKMNLMRAKDEHNELSATEKEQVKQILPTLDLMLTNSSSFDTVIENGTYTPVVEDGTLSFNTKEVISFLGTDGKTDSYTLYYNLKIADKVVADVNEEKADEEPVKLAKEVEEEKETEEPEEKEDEKEPEEEEHKIETEEKISGIAFLDEINHYPFDSKVEKEVEQDESEEERTFTIHTADNSYIKVKQEHEVEGNEVETEFKYTVVENGKTTLEYAIEIENEDDQLELGYEIGGMEYELRKEVVEGETIYHVDVENDANDTEALISFKKHTDEETGETTYEEIIK